MQDKVAIVTGGGSGIGRATCLRLAAEGAAVVVADFDDRLAQDVAAEIGGQAMPSQTDVASERSVGHMMDGALGRFGRVDFLVNCAGNAHLSTVAEMPLDGWQSILDVHLTGTFLCCRAAIAPITAAEGRIVNISSNYGFKGRPGAAHYSAVKAGVYSLTKTLALELAPAVNVNAVAPGPTDTPRWRRGLSDAEYQVKSASRGQDVPLGRLGQPEEIADVILFLLSPASRWITGQVIHVNGGEFLP